MANDIVPVDPAAEVLFYFCKLCDIIKTEERIRYPHDGIILLGKRARMKRTCKTILAYVLSAVLMATLGCTSLNGAAFAEADLLNQVYEISSVTMTTTVVPSPEQEATTSITTMEYDERGLVTSVIASDGTREIRTPVSWTFDEQGTPKSCFMEFAGQRVKVTIENR